MPNGETIETPAATPPATETPATPETLLGGAAPATETPAAEAPADYEIRLPEGVEADANLLGALKASVKDPESAQKLADTFFEVQAKASEHARTKWAEQQETWVKELKADKDFEANMFAVSAAMRQFGDEELSGFLNDSGLGNHPALFRLMASVGKALAENSVAGTNPPATAKSNEDPILKLYNHPTSKQR